MQKISNFREIDVSRKKLYRSENQFHENFLGQCNLEFTSQFCFWPLDSPQHGSNSMMTKMVLGVECVTTIDHFWVETRRRIFSKVRPINSKLSIKIKIIRIPYLWDLKNYSNFFGPSSMMNLDFHQLQTQLQLFLLW